VTAGRSKLVTAQGCRPFLLTLSPHTCVPNAPPLCLECCLTSLPTRLCGRHNQPNASVQQATPTPPDALMWQATPTATLNA
ncbi:unnamed protein product, partial [Citrullus colocynthis]